MIQCQAVTDRSNTKSLQFIAPRYWLTWLGLGILWCVTKLPYPVQMWVGAGIGKLALLFAKRRKYFAETNIRLCYPDLTGKQRLDLLRAHFDALGKGIIETALCWWGQETQLRGLFKITGIEHLHEAQKNNKGVILLSAHFTTLEIGGRLLAMETPFNVLYRTHKNALFEHIMHRARVLRFDKAIARNDMHALITSLKAGKAIWYAPDQNHGGTHSIFVPFFGIPASTITSTSRIAAISGAAVVPFFQKHLSGNKGYELTLYPALNYFPGDSVEADTVRINQLIENEIRKMPEQYLWVHRRFKTRPEGEDYPYE